MRKLICVILMFAGCLAGLPPSGSGAAAAALTEGIAPLAHPFQSARPVWPAGREKEKNLFVGFRVVFQAPAAGAPVMLRMAGSSLYRVTLNGGFVGHGPARGPHGFYRMDEWDLGKLVRPGENL